MKAEISHHGFKDENHYTGVYLQQGRMITDRDFNALCDRLKAQLENVGDKAIGTGIPKESGLLSSFVPDNDPASSWSAEFREDGGWVVANGVIGRASRVQGEFSYYNQNDLTLPPAAIAAFQAGYFYADIWDEVVTAIQDQDLLDPGLHGADTCFTTRRRVQIKRCDERFIRQIHEVADDQTTSICGHAINTGKLAEKGNASFEISIKDLSGTADICNPCEDEVDIGIDLGNYLFRLEVHDVEYDLDGIPQAISLKWSNENGAFELTADVTTADLKPQYSYEVFTHGADLEMGMPANGFSPGTNRTESWIDGPIMATPGIGKLVRRWNGHARFDIANRGNSPTGFSQGNAISNTNFHWDGDKIILNLDQVKVELDVGGKHIVIGDYWMALARSNTTDKIRSLDELPIGINHNYCLLGYSEDGRTFKRLSPGDKRRLHFPELTCIHADDVNYTPKECQHSVGATNVQEALDLLCAAIPGPYLSLRMSEGTGQETYIGQTLPGPIRVIVENENGDAVPNVTVRFTVEAPFNGIDSLAMGGSNSTIYLEVITGSNGEAFVNWTLNGSPGLHRLKAEIIGTPQVNAGVLYFSALAKEQSPYPMIEKVTWANGSQFRNDWHVDIDKIEQGFTIHFLEDIIQELVTPDVLTLHMEYIQKDFGEYKERYHLIVCGDIKTDSRSATFVPHEGFIRSALNRDNVKNCEPTGIRFHIKLKGRFVFDTTGRPFDAFVPGMPATERIYPDFDVVINETAALDEYVTNVVSTPAVETGYSRTLASQQFASTPSIVRAAAARRVSGNNVTSAASSAAMGAAIAPGVFGGGIPATVTSPARPDLRSGRFFGTSTRRIALNYTERGVGHPSDLEAWFYCNLIDKDDNPEVEWVPGVLINWSDKRRIAQTGLFNDRQIETLMRYQGNISDSSQLASITGFQGDQKNWMSNLNIAWAMRNRRQIIRTSSFTPIRIATLTKCTARVYSAVSRFQN